MVRLAPAAALLSLCLLSPAVHAQSAKATPTPRVLVRLPFGVPAAQQDAVVAKTAAAVKEAGALSIKQQDFANAAGGREEVKTILQSARANLTQASGHLGGKRFDDAVRSLEKAVADYESIGSDLWRQSELSYAYLKLGLARVKKNGGKMTPDAVEAFRRARTLDPALDLIEFEDDEIALFKKGAAGASPIPPPPGEGFYSLARVMGLDGLVEVRVDPKGIYQLRVHRITPVNVRSSKVASKVAGLDASARQQLKAALRFDPGAVAAATPAPTATAVAMASPEGPGESPEGARTRGQGTPIPGREVAWESVLPSPTATPLFSGTSEPTPAPTAVAVVRNGANGGGVRNGANGNGRGPQPTPTPEERSIDDVPATGRRIASDDSWAALVGGVDRRSALYAGAGGFTAVPSGVGGSAHVRTWIGFGKVWAVAAHAGAMQRSYLVSETNDTVKSATAMDAGVHLLRSDDADGMWWIGGGATYVSEPGISDPGGSVPGITRISPGVSGMAQFRMSRIALRLRGTAGVGLEMGTGEGFGDGVGYDVVGEASASFALTNRLKLASGLSARRLYTEFADKKSSVEARHSAWLGIEAGF